jgi:hypothetical protein
MIEAIALALQLLILLVIGGNLWFLIRFRNDVAEMRLVIIRLFQRVEALEKARGERLGNE